METAAAELPDDVDALKAMVLALTEKAELLENQAAQNEHLAAERIAISDSRAEVAEARIKAADERIATLTAIVKMLERSRYGRRSERLNDEQCAFVFEEIESGVGEAVADLETVAPDRAKRAPRPRKGFAAHLERMEQVIEPEVPEDCEGLDRLLIGEDVSERLDVTPAKFRVIVTRRPKYAYRNRDGVFQAPAPVHIIASGIPTERLLAQIAVSKYADGLPLYRQETIYARDGVEPSRALMAQWMGKVGFELQPLADYVLERIRQAERVFADETSLPTLAPGSGQVKKAWLWAYARDDRPFGATSPPMVAYRFEDSHGSACVARHMAGFAGILQVDGYSAYTKLAKANAGANDAMALAGCWAHLRRRFYELHVSGVSRLATQTVATMAELWKVEDEVRGRDPAYGGPPGSVRSHRHRPVQAMAKGIASHLRKVETGRGDPLCNVTAGSARALPRRRPGRDRFQHCRARYQAPDNNPKK